MSDVPFKPVAYLKQGCPFCLKLRIFLLESGLLASVTIREFVPGSAEEQAIRADLAGKVEKLSFPTAELAPGEYLNDSDGIVAALATEARVDPARLPTFSAYINGAFKQMQALYRENIELKKQLA